MSKLNCLFVAGPAHGDVTIRERAPHSMERRGVIYVRFKDSCGVGKEDGVEVYCPIGMEADLRSDTVASYFRTGEAHRAMEGLRGVA